MHRANQYNEKRQEGLKLSKVFHAGKLHGKHVYVDAQFPNNTCIPARIGREAESCIIISYDVYNHLKDSIEDAPEIMV